jgi:hypothetical protein
MIFPRKENENDLVRDDAIIFVKTNTAARDIFTASR